jgi:hypothetical protein
MLEVIGSIRIKLETQAHMMNNVTKYKLIKTYRDGRNDKTDFYLIFNLPSKLWEEISLDLLNSSIKNIYHALCSRQTGPKSRNVSD